MNVNFGLFAPLEKRVSKKERGELYARRSIDTLKKWMEIHTLHL